MIKTPAACRFVLLAVALAVAPGSSADTAEFTITDDAALNTAIAQARSEFLSGKPFTRLDATVLIPNGDGTWRRGSYNPTAIAYPASCVKLACLAAAMYWCRTNGHPYTYLDSSVRPMIEASDNYATGQVVDAITGAPNLPSFTSSADPAFMPWYNKRLYTENCLICPRAAGEPDDHQQDLPDQFRLQPDRCGGRRERLVSGRKPDAAEGFRVPHAGDRDRQDRTGCELLHDGAADPRQVG